MSSVDLGPKQAPAEIVKSCSKVKWSDTEREEERNEESETRQSRLSNPKPQRGRDKVLKESILVS